MTPGISFIVPVRNDADRLDVCLRSIVRNQYEPGDIEIVVIDNGSTDRSAEIARRHGARVIEISDGPVSSLRNRGADVATADILAFVDADNEIVPGWAAAATANLTGEVGATGALYVAPPAGTWVQRGYGVLRGRSQTRQDVGWLGSGNLAVRRSLFKSLGGFDASLEACEDVDFCFRLRATGSRLVADPRIGSVHHGDPKTLQALFRGELWRGRDNLRVSFRRPISWRGVASATVPVLDTILLGGMLLGVATEAIARGTGRLVVAACLLGIAGLSAARTFYAFTRFGHVTLLTAIQGFAVTLVYDLARALALVTKTPHRSARPRRTAETP